MQVDKFPRVTVTDYYAFGAIDPTPRNWYSWSANGTVSKLMGSHTFKLGADWRTIGIKTQSFTNGAGTFFVDRFYTSNNPLTNGTTNTGNAMASLLLGYPSGQPGNECAADGIVAVQRVHPLLGRVSAGRLARQRRSSL